MVKLCTLNRMLEKRRHARLNVDLPIILRHGGRILPATALNISCGGMCIRASDSALSNDQPVEIIFDLEETQKDISLCARITRVDSSANSTDFGVEFTNVFSAGHKAILEYLGKNLN